MRPVTNVVRRGAVFYYRRRVPSNLQPIVGKMIIRESLETREPAKARRLAADRNLFWERRFEAAESQLAQAARRPKAAIAEAVVRKELVDHELREIVADYRRQLLADDEEVRMRGLGGKSDGIPNDQHDALGEMLLDAEKFAAEDISRGKHLASWRLDEVDEYLAKHGHTLDKDSESYKRLAVEFLYTAAECIQLWKDRHAGKVVRTPTPEPIQSGTKKKTADDLLEGWKAERKPKQKSFETFGAKVRDFEKHLEGRGLESATPVDATEWKAARLAAGKMQKSVTNDIYALKAVMGWAAENHHIAQNPFRDVRAGLNRSKKGRKSTKRPFTEKETISILLAVRSETGFLRWLPWLEALTGARIAELAQLTRSDVKDEDGVRYFDINEDTAEAGPKAGKPDAAKKSVKTESSARKIPVHPQLVAEGFMDFIESRPAGAPLFDDLVPDRFGSRGGTASKRLGRFIRVKMGLSDKRIAPCHSFRHRFKDMCRDAEIHKEVHDALTGHTEGDVGALYGEGFTLKRLAEETAKIKWIDVDGKPKHSGGGAA